MRSPPQRGAVGEPIECSSDRATTFACDFPPVVFLASDPRQCSPDAIVARDGKLREVVENRGTYVRRRKAKPGRRSPAKGMPVSTLTVSFRTEIGEEWVRKSGPRSHRNAI